MAKIVALLCNVTNRETLCYLVAVIIGLLADMTVSYVLRAQLGLPNVLAALCGFCCGLILNYINFEKWVFGRGYLSWTGLLKVLVAAQSALIIRLAIVWCLTIMGLSTLAVFSFAIIMSFSANFFLTRFFMYKNIS